MEHASYLGEVGEQFMIIHHNHLIHKAQTIIETVQARHQDLRTMLDVAGEMVQVPQVAEETLEVLEVILHTGIFERPEERISEHIVAQNVELLVQVGIETREVVKNLPQECSSEYIVEQSVEETLEVSKVTPQEHTFERIVQQMDDLRRAASCGCRCPAHCGSRNNGRISREKHCSNCDQSLDAQCLAAER